MRILGIETSCDETAAAVVENGQILLSNVVNSQIDIHAEYGGVVPEVAARSHLEVINPVINKALSDASCTWDDIDAIAVTYAPGLIGSLLIGTLAARTLAIIHKKPLYKIHHVEAHVYANFITKQHFSASSSATTISRIPPFTPGSAPTGGARAAVALRDTLRGYDTGLSSGDVSDALEPITVSSSEEAVDFSEAKIQPNATGWPTATRRVYSEEDEMVMGEHGGIESSAHQPSIRDAGLVTSEARDMWRGENGWGDGRSEKVTSVEGVGCEMAEGVGDVDHKPLQLPKNQPSFPLLALIVSGGHSQLVLFKNHGDYQLIGQTQDDAVGEAFDKVAKILGLPYPGGPSISEAAKHGDPKSFQLPIAKLQGKYDFSFSGLKTAVLRAAQKEVGKDYSFPSHELPGLVNDELRHNMAASFQYTAVKTLVDKTVQAYRGFSPASVVIAGGVAANQELRRQLSEALPIDIEYAPIQLCTDNAAMIAALGYFRAQTDQPADPYNFEVQPSLSMLSNLQQGATV